jgi:hypothetical protein
MWGMVKEWASAVKTLLHSCSSIIDLLPDMIDVRLDAVNPVQTNCKNIEPERLKSEFGGKITFWHKCWSGGDNAPKLPDWQGKRQNFATLKPL